MENEEIKAMMETLGGIETFVKERFDPLTGEVTLLREENERLAADILTLQNAQKDIKRGTLTNAAEALRVQSGSYAGMTPLDVALMRGFARSQLTTPTDRSSWLERADEARADLHTQTAQAPDAIMRSSAALSDAAKKHYHSERQYEDHIRGMLADFDRASVRASMDSTTATAGDELVPTLEARELWMDVNLQTMVAALIPTFSMPSAPFDVPRQLGDVNFYPGTENIATTSTAPTTGKTTLTPYELVGQVPFSFTLEEDSIIALLPEIRLGMVRNVAEVLDDVILNADTSTTTNINADGATLTKSTAGKGHWLLGYDGIIHLPLVDNTSEANDHNAAVSDDMFNEIRSKRGKYGVRPSENVWIMDVNTYIRSQSITNFRTMDKLGPNATILNGMLGAVEGIPVVVSEQMKLADTDGKVTSAGNGTDTGRLLLVNRTQWAQGFRREMSVAVTRDELKRQTVITVSFRHALNERSGTKSTATHTGLQYDITGV